jgi:hypothetical protein
MRHLFVCILLLTGLTACVGPSAPGSGRCSKGGEVCVKATAVEPIQLGEPVTVTITVTTEKDTPILGVSLYHDVDVFVDGPQGWEKEAKDSVVYKGGAGWAISTKANQPFSFTRKVRFPLREGIFTLVVSAGTPSFRAEDSVLIYLTRAGGKIYLSGTSVPIPGWTPGQPAPAVTVTRGPSPTFIPTPGHALSPLATPRQSLSPLATPTRSTPP